MSCRNAGCVFTFEHIGRRTNVTELLEEMDRHMKEECPSYDAVTNDYPADIDEAKEIRL